MSYPMCGMKPDSESGNVLYLEGVVDQVAELTLEERTQLDRINRLVAGQLSLTAAMELVREVSAPLCPCDRLSLAFLEGDGARLVSYWTQAAYEPVLLKNGFHQDIHGSTLEAVVRRGQVRIIRDLAVYLERHPGSVSTELLVREGVRSSMTCPLKVEGRVVGVLFRSSRQSSAYEPRHGRLHEYVAERLSQAVEKAYRIEQLTAANQAYGEMLGFVSHELKGPLATMLLDSDMLARGLLGPLSDRQKDRVERLLKQAGYLGELVRDYLDLARIEEGLVLRHPRRFSMHDDLVKPALDATMGSLEHRHLTLAVQTDPTGLEAEGEPELLRIVLINLLTNAGRYGREGGRVRVHSHRVDGDRIRVTVWNEGTGFRAGDKDRLFRRFSRLPTPEFQNTKGTGVGLYTSWRILQLHQGRMLADSEYGVWAEFGFEWPCCLVPVTVPGSAL